MGELTCHINGKFFRLARARTIARILQPPPGALMAFHFVRNARTAALKRATMEVTVPTRAAPVVFDRAPITTSKITVIASDGKKWRLPFITLGTLTAPSR
jgi:hypothetical protein